MPMLIAPKGKTYESFHYHCSIIGHPVYRREKAGYLIAYCPHNDEADLVRARAANGSPLFRWRCRTCTKLFASVSKADVDRTSTPWTDLPDGLIEYEEYFAEVNRYVLAQNAELEKTLQQQRNTAYEQYLQSSSWRLKRDAVMKRDCYLCQGCLIAQATEVHHLTYDRIYNEMLFDLVAVCHDCHINKIHGNRAAR